MDQELKVRYISRGATALTGVGLAVFWLALCEVFPADARALILLAGGTAATCGLLMQVVLLLSARRKPDVRSSQPHASDRSPE